MMKIVTEWFIQNGYSSFEFFSDDIQQLRNSLYGVVILNRRLLFPDQYILFSPYDYFTHSTHPALRPRTGSTDTPLYGLSKNNSIFY